MVRFEVLKGVYTMGLMFSLEQLNDVQGESFEKIANRIESEPEGLFE